MGRRRFVTQSSHQPFESMPCIKSGIIWLTAVFVLITYKYEFQRQAVTGQSGWTDEAVIESSQIRSMTKINDVQKHTEGSAWENKTCTCWTYQDSQTICISSSINHLDSILMDICCCYSQWSHMELAVDFYWIWKKQGGDLMLREYLKH